MGKRKQSKIGYGIHNVCKDKVTKKDIKIILTKRWKDISSLDLYRLYNNGWKTVDIKDKFKTTITSVLNRLRCL